MKTSTPKAVLAPALAVAIAGLALSACESTPKKADANPGDTPEVSTGLAALMSETEPVGPATPPQAAPVTSDQQASLFELAANDLKDFLNPTNPDEPATQAGDTALDLAAQREAALRDAQPANQPATQPALGEASQSPSTPALAESTPRPAPTPADPGVQSAAAGLLESARQAQAAGSAPYETALLIAALEASMPQLATSDEQLITDTGLTPDEQAAVDAVRQLLAGIQTADATAAPGALADLLATIRDQAADAAPVGIRKAQLCTRVDGFGQYDPFPSNAFLAGQRNRVIVYTEIDRFGHRATGEVDKRPVSVSSEPTLTIDLTQELSLYHDADGMLAWRRPAQGERTITRARLRDYYLVDLIELPETLSVGKYRLKVTVRDASDGSVAETTIPVRVVADRALTAAGTDG